MAEVPLAADAVVSPGTAASFAPVDHPLDRTRRARLVLDDGSSFEGYHFGAPRSVSGEIVFATGMVGYPESMTDPSYRGQLLAFTYPLVGNYGVPALEGGNPLPPGFESDRIQVSAIVVSTISSCDSHWSAGRSLERWMEEEGIPGLCAIDTRALTRRLRSHGTRPARLEVDGAELEEGFADPAGRNLVAEVSCPEPTLYAAPGSGPHPRVVLVDCGAKFNIIRSLNARGADVLRVPFDHDLEGEKADGFLISNGPGDPKMAGETVEQVRRLLSGERPVFGICLGNQVLSLAAGADTYKLDFGHRGQNQPCLEVGTKRCMITSQNHGYAVDGKKLPVGWSEWFVNTNDGSNEGIVHESGRFRSVQFHPEATPGPRDAADLFDRFLEVLR
ncbi:MAG: glutamine-hydrolyzing carbamoyl-phosphate synthase small subunit [Planctomycetota bacterium]